MYQTQTVEPHVNGGERTAHDDLYTLTEVRKYYKLSRAALARADLAREADIKPGDLYRVIHDTRSYSRGRADIRRTRQLASHLDRSWSRENGHRDTEVKDRVRGLREALFAYQQQ